MTTEQTQIQTVRDIVNECRESAERWTEKCREIDASAGLFEVLKTLDHAREKLRVIRDAEFFERAKSVRCETAAAEARSTDIQRYKDFMAASDQHMSNAQRIEKIAAPLEKEIERLRAVYKVLNASPPVQA